MDRVRFHLRRCVHCRVGFTSTPPPPRKLLGDLGLTQTSFSVGVTQVDRPAAAPQTGPFELDVIAVGAPGFVAGLTATINLFGTINIIFLTVVIISVALANMHENYESWLRINAHVHARHRGNEIAQ